MRIAAALLMLGLLSCPPARAERVGVIVRGNADLFFQVLERGAVKAASDLNAKLLVRHISERAFASGLGDVQPRIIDYMLEQNVSAIVLVPEPMKGVAGQISVPVPLVLADRDGPQFKAVSTVSTDNYAAGRKAAITLAQAVPKGANVVMLRLAPEIGSTTQREEGFLSVAREMGWKVALDDYVGLHPRESEKRVVDVLHRHAGKIDAIFAPNETTTTAAISVLTDFPPQSRPHLAGFDWRPTFRDALEAGILHFTLLQDPESMGYRSVAAALTAARGSPPPSRISIDLTTINRDNMNAAAVQAFLANYEGR